MKTTIDNPDTHNPDSYTLTHKTGSESGGSFFGHLWASIAVTTILTAICCGIYPLVIWGVAQTVFPAKANGSLVKKDGTSTTDVNLAVGSSLLGQNFALPGYFAPRPSAAGSGYDATNSGGSNLGPLSDKLINGLTTSPTAPATQPAESLTFDGLRLRTIHYAVANNISFKLYNVAPDGTRAEVALSKFQDGQGNLNDIALVDAFPHPTTPDDDKRTVLIADNFSQPIPSDAVTASGSGLDPHISPENAEIQKARVASARNIKPEQVEEMIAAHTDGRDLGIFGDPGVNVLMLNCALDAKYPIPAPPATQAAPATQPATK